MPANALRADMPVRPYGWFTNIHGASGCDRPVRLCLPPLQRRGMYHTVPRTDTTGLLKKCGIVRIQSLAPFCFGFHKLDG